MLRQPLHTNLTPPCPCRSSPLPSCLSWLPQHCPGADTAVGMLAGQPRAVSAHSAPHRGPGLALTPQPAPASRPSWSQLGTQRGSQGFACSPGKSWWPPVHPNNCAPSPITLKAQPPPPPPPMFLPHGDARPARWAAWERPGRL